MMKKEAHLKRSSKIIPILSIGLLLLIGLWYLVDKGYLILKW